MADIKCKHCGAAIDAFSRECPYCGMAVTGTTGNSAQDFINKTARTVNDATKRVDQVMGDEAGQNKVYGVLCYLGILWVISFFLRREVKFVRFHLNQGLVLMICNVATSLITSILSSANVPFAEGLGILNLVWFIFEIMGIVHAIKGEEKELPIIGQFKIMK